MGAHNWAKNTLLKMAVIRDIEIRDVIEVKSPEIVQNCVITLFATVFRLST